MITQLRNICLLLLIFLIFSPGLLFADTHAASSCSRVDVGTAVTAASSGDTVTVPACPGGVTWTTPLIITKGITLQGAGIGQTVIKAKLGYAAVSYYAADRRTINREIILYKPSNPSLNEPFRLTGFEIDLQSTSVDSGNYPPRIHGTSPTDILTNIRIDHNKFNNLFDPVGFGGRGYDFEFIQARGVIDHNVFVGRPTIHAQGYLDGGSWGKANWLNETYTPGTSNSLYVENNLFQVNGDCTLTGAGWGGRYVFRYNTVVYSTGPILSYYERPLDIHGNGPGFWGPMGMEAYGNSYTGPSIINFHFSNLRGGEVLEFYNQATGMGNGTSGHVVHEEKCDDISGSPSTATDGQPMHISDSYFWNNRGGTGGTTLNNPSVYSPSGCGTYQLWHNTDFWNHTTSFNGTSGMGCGTLGSRPATCTTGVGYWATNQSCSSVPSENVGANVSTPISGTLYVCTSTNTWKAYYTPFTYPHPLVLGDKQEKIGTMQTPNSPSNLMVQ
jgi:hypothetical protein